MTASVLRELLMFVLQMKMVYRAVNIYRIHIYTNACIYFVGGVGAEEDGGDDEASARERRRKRRRVEGPPVSDSCSDSDDSDMPEYEYIDVTDSAGAARDFFVKVGRKFEDTDDGGTFKILGVCAMRKRFGRRSTNTVYAYTYVDVTGDQSDYQYTPVREILNSYWVRWLDVDTLSRWAARASRRGVSSAPVAAPPVSTDSNDSCSSSSVRRSPMRTRASSRRR